ncbi:uncharacterized protein LOC770295 isoform X2 [Gallus gallus]|uniref:uncharacterized protein LOC770295 isoform X2 n=1 Tax=Gallus gallus TaxID=9031 RepID=UPI001AE6EEB0|nr:uncharacterized protein LOC770295 isoform X2 [Gallus gallus]
MPLRGARGGARGALTPSGPAGRCGTGRPRRLRAARRGAAGPSRSAAAADRVRFGRRRARNATSAGAGTAHRSAPSRGGRRRAEGGGNRRAELPPVNKGRKCRIALRYAVRSRRRRPCDGAPAVPPPPPRRSGWRSLLHRPRHRQLGRGNGAGTNVSQVAGNSCTEAPEQGRTCLRIIESFELEEAPKGHLVQLPRNKQGHLQLHQVLSAPSSLTLRASSQSSISPLVAESYLGRASRYNVPASSPDIHGDTNPAASGLCPGFCWETATAQTELPPRSGCRSGGAASWLHPGCVINECRRAPCSSLLLRENLVCFRLYFLNDAHLFPRRGTE